MTAVHEDSLAKLQQKIWNGSLPLEIHLAKSECRTFDISDPYIVQAKRLSYLPSLLLRLFAFFAPDLIDPESAAPHRGWFSYEDVPLKWHYPLGLLYDLYSGAEPTSADDRSPETATRSLKPRILSDRSPIDATSVPAPTEHDAADYGSNESDDSSGNDERQERLPWKLTIHFSDWPTDDLVPLDAAGNVLFDTFRNSVKEASFVRHGTGKVVMSLGYEDSTQMWKAVEEVNLSLYLPVQNKLLNPPGMVLKHLPIRIYLPGAAPVSQAARGIADDEAQPRRVALEEDEQIRPGTLRVVQALTSPYMTGGASRHQSQTIGMVLNNLLPALFPSRRSPLLALAVLHGAVVPLAADAQELARVGAYADGWLHLSVRMMR